MSDYLRYIREMIAIDETTKSLVVSCATLLEIEGSFVRDIIRLGEAPTDPSQPISFSIADPNKFKAWVDFSDRTELMHATVNSCMQESQAMFDAVMAEIASVPPHRVGFVLAKKHEANDKWRNALIEIAEGLSCVLGENHPSSRQIMEIHDSLVWDGTEASLGWRRPNFPENGMA